MRRGVENENVRIDATKRFSERVENYRRFRPGYPAELGRFLTERFGLAPGSVVADAGSGTGLLSRLLLDAGMSVIGIEPNREMREAGDRLLADCAGFRSVDAMAENTTLPDSSVELITAG
jgi:ubiquinone/menaquinone biosynthesis C-methylase UbiE